MAVADAFAYLIHPGKGKDPIPDVTGKALDLAGDKLAKMLNDIFVSDSTPQDFEVKFNPTEGAQTNVCRDLFVAFSESPGTETGMAIAKRLQSSTDNRSGIGLLFLLAGNRGLKRRIVASRFPTEQAILAELESGNLAIEFLEQVFIKKLSSYKALMLEHETPKDGFWKGLATDRQAGRSGEHISEYWLKDFLDADFFETPAAGTRRLAIALKAAIKVNPNLEVKEQIASASTLAADVYRDKMLSIKEFCDHFGFSESTTNSIKSQLSKESLFDKKFKFDSREFKQANPYRTVELDTGAILTAPNDDFDKVFKRDSEGDGRAIYRTEGRISDQRLTKK